MTHAISGFMSALGLISPRMGSFLGMVLGRIWFLFDKKHKKIALNSLMHAYASELNPRERYLLARKVFENSATMLFEHARFHKMNPDDYTKLFKVTGLQHLKAAQAKGRGILCFSGHLGNWEVASVISFLIDITFSVVYKKIEYPPMEDYIKAKRASSGCKMLPLHNALGGVLASLAKGEAVVLIVDQNSRKREHSVFIDFLGRKASANMGLAKLALGSKAPVVPIFTYRKNGWTHLEFLPEIPLIQTGNEKEDILTNTQKYHGIIEDYIRKYPDQWFWLHNRWRTRPLDEI